MTSDTPSPRGMKNPSGVACHITAPLQLLFHAFPTLIPHQEDLKQLQTKTQSQTDCDEPIDPSSALQYLKTGHKMECETTGDATKQFLKLWNILKLPKEYGKLGKTISAEIGRIRRTKQPATTQSVPFPFKVEVDDTLEDAIEDSLVQQLNGYDFDQVESYHEETLEEEEGDDDDVWRIYRNLQFRDVPEVFVVQPKRSAWQFGALSIDMSQMQVESMDLKLVGDETASVLNLRGALLYASEKQDGDSSNGEGHCVALVSRGNKWFLLNDEVVSELDEAQALQLLSTQTGDLQKALLEGMQSCPMLLLYATATAVVEAPVPPLEAEEGGHSWVGRRLKVKWAKGKYYEGQIISYGNGKHKVHYDDGDEREYNLKLKTYEWVS